MTAPLPTSANQPQDEINLLELFGALLKGWRWIAAAAVAALFLGLIALLRAEPLYLAGGLLQLESRAGASMALSDTMRSLLESDGPSSEIENEIEILKSRMVLGQAVQELDLQTFARPKPFPILGRIPKNLHLPDMSFWVLNAYEWGNESLSIGTLTVPEPWLDEVMELKITGLNSYSLTTPDGQTHTGAVQQLLTLPEGFTLMVTALEGGEGRVFELTRRSLPNAVADLQANFKVASAGRGASILKVTYTDPDPRQAERILDAISQAYLNQNISRSSAEAANSLTFIDAQLPRAQAAVTAAQEALNSYQKAQKSVDLTYETQSLLEGATKIEADLNALSLQEEDLKKRFTEAHPTYQALQDNRRQLERQLQAFRDQTTSLPETQKEIFNLTRDLEVAQEIYVQLLNRKQELNVVRASTVGSVRIVDTAYSNGQKISPKTGLTLTLSLMLGLIGGAAGVLVYRALHQGVRGAQEIEALNLPVFATVNYSPEAVNHREIKGELPILALSRPDDLVIEALRSLRTALHFGMLDAKSNTLAITSAAPGAGKSFLSVNFAVVAAQAGQRVCVIDADMRKGYIRRYFNRPKETAGLAEYLAGDKSLEEVLVAGPVNGLSVITAGHFPPNPSELLMRAEFQALLTELTQRFDLVVVDCPPVLAVTDPVIVARYCGASLFVARHMETMQGEIAASMRAMEAAGLKFAGAVLNAYRHEEATQYGGQYQYYNYRYAYKSDKD